MVLSRRILWRSHRPHTQLQHAQYNQIILCNTVLAFLEFLLTVKLSCDHAILFAKEWPTQTCPTQKNPLKQTQIFCPNPPKPQICRKFFMSIFYNQETKFCLLLWFYWLQSNFSWFIFPQCKISLSGGLKNDETKLQFKEPKIILNRLQILSLKFLNDRILKLMAFMYQCHPICQWQLV